MPWDFKVIPMLYKQKYFPVLQKAKPFLMGRKKIKDNINCEENQNPPGFLIHSSNKVLIFNLGIEGLM